MRVIIGAELFAARMTAGMSVSSATTALGWHTGKLTRMTTPRGVSRRSAAMAASVSNWPGQRAAFARLDR
jgi:hypothetical protein